MTRIVLFNSQSANLDSPTFEIRGQRTFQAIGMQPGDFVTFELIKVAAGARAFVCGCFVSEAGPGVVEGVQELQCASCETLTQRPVRLTPQNPVVVLDFTQVTIMRAIYHGNGIDMGTTTVWTEETNTQDLTDELRGCPPIFYADADQTWSDTGMYRCLPNGVGIEYEQVNDCGRRRWFLDATRSQIWVDTQNYRCTSNDTGVEVEQTNQCGDRRWQLSLTVTQEWVANGVHRCTVTGDVELQEVNQCGDRRWTVCGSVEWVDTGKFRCSADGLVLELEQTNQCGHRRWFISPEGLTWTVTGVTRCAGANVESQETNDCGDERWTVTGVNTWTPTGVTNCVSGTVRNQESDSCGNARTVDTGTPCGNSNHLVASLVVSPLSAPEGSNFCWTLTLDSPVVGDSLNLTGALSGTEQAEHSYPFPSMTILPGQSSGQMCVTTVTDLLTTADLRLCLQIQPNARLSGIPAALCATVEEGTGNPNFSTHTIISIVPNASPITEGQAACWDITINSPVVGASLPINFSLSGDEQTVHSYPAPTLNIPIGATTGQVCVTTTDDIWDEPDRLLGLTALTSGRILGVPAVSNINVLDNDAPPAGASTHTVLTVVPSPLSASEGTTFNWTVTLNSPVTVADLLIVSTLSGDEQGIHGYPAPSVIIPVGASSGVLTVITTDDLTREPTRLLGLQIVTSPRVTAVPAVANVDVLDNDPIPVPLALPGGDQGGDCIINHPSSGLTTAYARFLTDGNLAVKSGSAGLFDLYLWLPPGGIISEYEVRCDDATGVSLSRTGAARNTWLNASTLRDYNWSRSGPAPGSGYVNYVLSVRRVGELAADTTFTVANTFVAVNTICP